MEEVLGNTALIAKLGVQVWFEEIVNLCPFDGGERRKILGSEMF